MRFKDHLKGFVAGILAATIIVAGLPVFGASVKKTIDVYYNNIKIYFDGIEKVPNAQPFIYEGSTYVPLRFVSEALGKEVEWDSKNASIYIGKKPSGNMTYLENMKTHTDATKYFMTTGSFTSNMGKNYIHGYVDNPYGMYDAVFYKTYLLNAQYERFSAVIDIASFWTSRPYCSNIGSFDFFVDGVKVYSTGSIPSNITAPYIVDIDLTNATEFTIVGNTKDWYSISNDFSSNSINKMGIFDAIFYN